MILDFQPLGDRGIRVGFPQIISPEVNRKILAFVYAVQEAELTGILEMVPTYTAVSVFYDPRVIRYTEMIKKLTEVQERIGEIELPSARLVEIPVLYGGEVGPDIGYVAEYNNLSVDEVVRIHSSRPYLVYMVGFTPGFPYLGGMSERISTPRLSNPRVKIAGGSVGIGGSQTGIYSIDAPGGWQIIGHTPVKLYDPQKVEPVLLQAGDYVQFVKIEAEEYRDLQDAINRETFEPRIRNYEEGV